MAYGPEFSGQRESERVVRQAKKERERGFPATMFRLSLTPGSIHIYIFEIPPPGMRRQEEEERAGWAKGKERREGSWIVLLMRAYLT